MPSKRRPLRGPVLQPKDGRQARREVYEIEFDRGGQNQSVPPRGRQRISGNADTKIFTRHLNWARRRNLFWLATSIWLAPQFGAPPQ